MEINTNLSIKNNMLKKQAEQFRNKYVVRFLSEELQNDGSYLAEYKTIDGMNFVDRVSLRFAPDKKTLLAGSCTCYTRKTEISCVHIAAAALDYTASFAPTDNAGLTEFEADSEQDEAPAPFNGDGISENEGQNVSADVYAEESGPDVVPDNDPIIEESDIPADTDLPAEETEEDVTDDLPRRSMEVLFGNNTETGEELYWRPNDTEQIFHTNTGIIGTMGTGKTQFTKSLVTQLYREQLARKNFDGSPLNVLIFDYKGDYNETKPDFTEAVNAKVFKPYHLRYNPLALNRGSTFRPLLPVHTANVFKDTLTKSFRLGPKQQALLLDCLIEAYEKQGILPEDPATWSKPAPTFNQVYEVYLEHIEDKVPDSLTAAMNKLFQFRIFEPDPNKAISLSELIKGVTVIDLSGYESDLQSFIVAITLDQFYAQMLTMGSSKTDGHLRQLRSLILVDEADNFMQEDFPSLRKIMKEGREFGVGMVLSTQSLTHFTGGEDDYSRYILTWVVHNVSDLSQRDVEYIFKLQPKSPEITDIYAGIKGLVKHESITKTANADPVKIRDKAFFELDR